MKNEERINNMVSLNKIDSFDVIDFKKNPQAEKTLKDSLRIRKLDSKNNLRPYSVCEHIKHLKKEGEGLYFYFYFIKFFAILFLIISILSIIFVVYNSLGDGISLKSGINIILATTLGNSKKIYYEEDEIELLKNMTQIEKTDYINERNKELNIQFYIFVAFECLIAVIFFIAIYIFQIKVSKQIKEISKNQLSPRRYTLIIKGFPKNINKSQVEKYFSYFGKVQDVSFAYEYKNCLIHIVNLVKYKNQIKKLDASKNKNKLDKIDILIGKMKKEMEMILKKVKCEKFDIQNLSTLNVRYTFVIFDKFETIHKVIKDFNSKYSRKFYQKLFCINPKIDKNYLFDNKKLNLKVPDHPKNIVWENLEFTAKYRRIKLLLTFIASILLLIISFSIIFILNSYTESLKEIPCDNKNITEDLIANTFESELAEKLKFCFCSQQSVTILMEDKESFEYKTCSDRLFRELWNTLISFGIGIFITIMNIFIEFSIFKMVFYIRYHSITQIVKKQITFTFIIVYINTAFVLYFIYSNINGFAVIKIIQETFHINFFNLDNLVQDVDRKWYEKVGSKLIMPLLIAVFTPHFTEYFILLFSSCLKSIRVRWAKTKGEYIDIMKFETFDMGYRFKNVLILIVTCFTFSAGIPIFNIFVFFGLFFTFWIHKIILINYTNKSPPYSSELIKNTYKFYKIGLILHLIFAIYFLSNEDVFPSKMNFSLDYTNLIYQGNNFGLSQFLSRMWKVFPLVIILGLVLLSYIFEVFLIHSLKNLFKCLKKKKIFSHANFDGDTYENNLLHFSTTLKNYQIKENPDYREILNFTMQDIVKLKALSKSPSFSNLLKMSTFEENQINEKDKVIENSKSLKESIFIKVENNLEKHQSNDYFVDLR